jgi:uncharacterized RDD family membrane protein YckC
MDHERITIASATGVDVTLSIAGPGARSYAFVIDWHFRLLLALAWFFAAGWLASGHLLGPPDGEEPSTTWVLAAVLPALAIYFLYHPVLEIVMRGRTPGKRVAGVRIVDEAGGLPSVGAILIRNVFRLIDALPGFYAVGLVTSILTTRRVRVGDLAAGTLLVTDHAATVDRLEVLGSVASGSTQDPALAEVALDLLARWDQLGEERRATVALAVLRRLEPHAEPGDLALLRAVDLRARILAALQLEAPP